ncbi:ATP synthase subunit I [Moraxella nasovis]|uniref:ATP synthase subunit I n=1 Tax=Moraxella nasovis TaxID=2904121 RepID=UPI001F61497C|nr:ATP synthase subunit I [Moraxella nasovis]UNU72700.1 ATP synthase subunit I [Moraxella nasovis]
MSAIVKPAKRHQRDEVFAIQRQLSLALLILIVLTAAVEFGIFQSQALVYTKSLTAGLVLSYLAHWAFAIFAYRQTRIAAAKAIMLNVYLGQMIKWLLTLLGFALIFMLVRPIMASAVIIGYLLMQLITALMLSRLTS